MDLRSMMSTQTPPAHQTTQLPPTQPQRAVAPTPEEVIQQSSITPRAFGVSLFPPKSIPPLSSAPAQQQEPSYTQIPRQQESTSIQQATPGNTRRYSLTACKAIVHQNKTGEYKGQNFWRAKTPIANSENPEDATYMFLIETNPLSNRYKANLLVVVGVGQDFNPDRSVPIGFFWERTVQEPSRQGGRFYAGKVLFNYPSCTTLMNIYKGTSGDLVAYLKVSYDPSQDPRLASQSHVTQVSPAAFEEEEVLPRYSEDIPF